MCFFLLQPLLIFCTLNCEFNSNSSGNHSSINNKANITINERLHLIARVVILKVFCSIVHSIHRLWIFFFFRFCWYGCQGGFFVGAVVVVSTPSLQVHLNEYALYSKNSICTENRYIYANLPSTFRLIALVEHCGRDFRYRLSMPMSLSLMLC